MAPIGACKAEVQCYFPASQLHSMLQWQVSKASTRAGLQLTQRSACSEVAHYACRSCHSQALARHECNATTLLAKWARCCSGK